MNVMKILSIRSLVFVAFISFLSCKEKEEIKSTDTEVFPEFIAFGRFQSSGCGSSEQCVELFKMESGSLKEDSNENIPQITGPYVGNYSQELSQSDYEQIEAIFKNNIPDELLQHPSGLVGTPQEWYVNFFYFEYKTATRHDYWVIDGSFDGNLGAVLQTFITDLQNAQIIASN